MSSAEFEPARWLGLNSLLSPPFTSLTMKLILVPTQIRGTRVILEILLPSLMSSVYISLPTLTMYTREGLASLTDSFPNKAPDDSTNEGKVPETLITSPSMRFVLSAHPETNINEMKRVAVRTEIFFNFFSLACERTLTVPYDTICFGI